MQAVIECLFNCLFVCLIVWLFDCPPLFSVLLVHPIRTFHLLSPDSYENPQAQHCLREFVKIAKDFQHFLGIGLEHLEKLFHLIIHGRGSRLRFDLNCHFRACTRVRRRCGPITATHQRTTFVHFIRCLFKQIIVVQRCLATEPFVVVVSLDFGTLFI